MKRPAQFFGSLFSVKFRTSRKAGKPEARKAGSAELGGAELFARQKKTDLRSTERDRSKAQRKGPKSKAQRKGLRTAGKRGAKRLRRKGRAEEIKKRPPVVSGRRSLYAFSVPDSDGFPIAKGRGARPKPPEYPGETGAYFLSRLRLCPPLRSFRRGGQRNRGIGKITGPGGRKYFRRGLSRGVLRRQIRHKNEGIRPWEGRRSRSSHRGFRPAAACGRGRGNAR